MKKKADLKLIVCVAKDNLIGDKNPSGNGMLWHSKEELKHYKDTTVGQVTLMGKKTAACVPLDLMRKNREVIVLGRDSDVDKILHDYAESGKTVYICGGGEIYKHFLENFHIDELLISKLKEHVEVGSAETPVYFPDVEKYGYVMFDCIEYDDFILCKYKKR